jgi:hypothetical protein
MNPANQLAISINAFGDKVLSALLSQVCKGPSNWEALNSSQCRGEGRPLGLAMPSCLQVVSAS